MHAFKFNAGVALITVVMISALALSFRMLNNFFSNKLMEKDVTPILKKHKVRLWINGHDRNYQRSIPIDGTTYRTHLRSF